MSRLNYEIFMIDRSRTNIVYHECGDYAYLKGFFPAIKAEAAGQMVKAARTEPQLFNE